MNGGFAHLSAEGNLKRTSLNILFQQIKQARIKGLRGCFFHLSSSSLVVVVVASTASAVFVVIELPEGLGSAPVLSNGHIPPHFLGGGKSIVIAVALYIF